MLVASGELDERPGGPYVPTDRTDSGEVAVDQSTPGATRRSVYLQQHRTQLASLLEVFDAPSIVTTCTRRQPSTVPLQSLSLLNSDFVAARATRLADRLSPSATIAARPETGSTGLSCWSSAAPRPGRNATRPADSCANSRPGTRASTAPEARRRSFVDFCQMLLASDAFLYVE